MTPRLVLASAATVAAAALIPALVACSGSGQDGGSAQAGSTGTTAAGPPKHGPLFAECGGVSDQTMAQLTQVTGLVNTSKNSVGCQWLVGGGILGPHFSFTWYRGSPIGRERKTEELTRATVNDINIQGHSGFIALGEDLMIGKSLCEVGIQFDDDFIEWSVSFAQKPFPDPCEIAKELARQSIASAK